ncbi:hypothetical protein HZA97_05510 [Candidatus Woesearchaeota archaeon]|nr:hypothetical protein [Candidatus Woesearchaeota archaeon]
MNEYKNSLDVYVKIIKAYTGLLEELVTERIVPEENLVAFCLLVQQNYQFMLSTEQRRFCKDSLENVESVINVSYRLLKKRKVFRITLDDSFHEGKPEIPLESIRKMAKAVDKYEQDNKII